MKQKTKNISKLHSIMNILDTINKIKMFYIRKTRCSKNVHYHPEDDGIYLPEISHGKCRACGEFVKKEYDYVWRKVKHVR